MTPLITIIIPVYNSALYLSKCIESIINQTYRNLEVLLINDGSTDGSGEICVEFAKKDQRIKVVNKQNGGASSARNCGLELMRGEYVTFIDSDDYVNCQYIEKLFNILREKHADMSFCGYLSVGKKIKPGKEIFPSELNIDFNSTDTWNFLKRFLFSGKNIMPVCWRVLYKRSVVESLSFNPKIRIGEDLLFVLNSIIKANSISFTEEELYFYRKNNKNSIMSSYKRDYLKNQNELYEGIKSLFSNYICESKTLDIYCAWLCYACFSNEIKFGIKYKKGIIKEIRRSQLYAYFTLSNGLRAMGFKSKIKYLIVWCLVKTRLI